MGTQSSIHGNPTDQGPAAKPGLMSPMEAPGNSVADTLHRLKARQIELEEQNQALREAQHSLEEAHERYLDYYDFAPVGYLTLTDAGSISEINLTAAMLLGLERAVLLKRDFPAFLKPNDREAWHRVFTDLLLHDARNSVELQLEHDEQLCTWVRADCERLAKPGKPEQVRVTLTDISNCKLMEEELQEHQAQLESRVEQRTADLHASLRAAQLADQAKDAFLANVSHELRTPLGAVIGMACLALKYSENARQQDYLQKVDKAGRHMSRIINDLLDLSKVAAGRMELEAIEFSPREVLQHAHGVMMHKAEAGGLRLSHEASDDVPAILIGDALRLEQILLNLVGNAIKFTPAGKVEVRMGVAARSENRVCIAMEVEDSGIGMRPEDIAGLFQPFHQGDASINRKYGGTGLGLALSQRFAEMMDGTISVNSRQGKGSVFSLKAWLGVGDSVAAMPDDRFGAGHAPFLPMHYRNANVLIVEDQPIAMEIVSELLSSVGITAHQASNGQEAIDILGRLGPTAFDLVLMDIQMPVMSGLDATRQIRSWAGFDRLPIVAMTAQALTHERHIGAAAGMNDYLVKPFDPECFSRMLARWIPDSRMVQPGGEETT